MSSLHQRKQLLSSVSVYRKLDLHQKLAVDFCLDIKTAGLFFEQGTGKTWITGGVIEALWNPEFVGLGVVPLNNIDTTWIDFFRQQLPHVRLFFDFEEFREVSAPKLLLLHYEHGSLRHEKLIKKLRRLKFTLIFYDESQRLKERSTIASRTAGKLSRCAEYKIILSGTPIESLPQDLWGQFRFLVPDLLGDWKEFEAHFLENDADELKEQLKDMKPGSFKWQVMLRTIRIMSRKAKFREDRLEEFLDLIEPYAMRVTKEVLNLKDLNIHPVPVTLRGKQRKFYETLEKSMVARVNKDIEIAAPLKVTKLGKLHQACGGYVKDDDGVPHEIGRAKLRKALWLAKTKKKPIVIFCRYLEEVRALEEHLSPMFKRVEVYTGKVKKKERNEIKRDFQKGKIDVLICQIRTGGVGIDLYRSCVAIIYSLTYSFIDFEQAISRLHRRGQENEVDIFLLFARGTIDEDIYNAILSKKKVSDQVLNRLRKEGRLNHGQRKDHKESRKRHRSEVWRGRPCGRNGHPARVSARSVA